MHCYESQGMACDLTSHHALRLCEPPSLRPKGTAYPAHNHRVACNEDPPSPCREGLYGSLRDPRPS